MKQKKQELYSEIEDTNRVAITIINTLFSLVNEKDKEIKRLNSALTIAAQTTSHSPAPSAISFIPNTQNVASQLTLGFMGTPPVIQLSAQEKEELKQRIDKKFEGWETSQKSMRLK